MTAEAPQNLHEEKPVTCILCSLRKSCQYPAEDGLWRWQRHAIDGDHGWR